MYPTRVFSPREWARFEFSGVAAGDKRRPPRLVQAAAAMMRNPSASLPAQLQSPAGLKATYNLLGQSDLTPAAVIAPHTEHTRAAAGRRPQVLLIQDTSEVDYTAHPKTTGLGQIGDGKGRGYLLHTVLAVDPADRQVLGVARHASRLLVSGQHLKRGVLLYGAPGTGKTHTVRYLLGRLPGVTVVVLSGGALRMIAQACSVARALQPSVVVVEDVDLIAEERGPHMGQHPLLFQLLNEMDGLGQDIDVTFLLTTNRADLLEEALAARPGRVDHAALLPVPDAEARRRLVRLYQGGLEFDLSDPEVVISRTEGVTASFIKELLRRAALYAAEEEGQDGEPGGVPLRVTDMHMGAALDQLLDARSELTRVLLGGGAPREGDTGISGSATSRPGPRRPGRQ